MLFFFSTNTPLSVYGRPFERGRPCGHCLVRPVCPVPATRSQRTFFVFVFRKGNNKKKQTTIKEETIPRSEKGIGWDRQRLSPSLHSLLVIIIVITEKYLKKRWTSCESVAPIVSVFFNKKRKTWSDKGVLPCGFLSVIIVIIYVGLLRLSD